MDVEAFSCCLRRALEPCRPYLVVDCVACCAAVDLKLHTSVTVTPFVVDHFLPCVFFKREGVRISLEIGGRIIAPPPTRHGQK